MSTFLIQFLFLIPSAILFIFFFWKRLKEDYKSDAIFTAAITIFVPSVIFGFLSTFVSIPNLWFWLSGVVFVLSILFVIKRQKFKAFELYEAASLSAIILLLITYFYDFLINNYNLSLYYAIFLVLVLFVFYYVDRSYRKFTWYKSGRVGIAGLTAIALIFISRVVLGLGEVPVISILGKIEFILAGVVAFLNIFFIYHLSES